MAKKEISFADAVKGIEEILKSIEEGETDIDRLSEDVKRASGLIKICRARLRQTEQKIDEILKDIR